MIHVMLFCNLEEEYITFPRTYCGFRNIRTHLPHWTASQPRRPWKH